MAIRRLRYYSSVLTLGLLLLFTPLAQATIQVSFTESAPKDRFSIRNTGSCTLTQLTLTIDLSSSVGKLIFDTTDSGAGVEVFQPFEVREGEIQLISAQTVGDGDSALVLRIPTLAADSRVSFTIDVDDTLPQSELGNIRVTDAEIAQSRLQVETPTQAAVSALFGNDSSATAVLAPCPA